MQSGDLKVDWALRIDALTAVMLVVVTTVSSLVHLYSIGYMHEDPHRPRFFAYLSLFTFAMLALVTADNLAQLFFGWEGVGLASYLLIGFWYQKPEANAAAIKAFIVNRVGDFGFAIGIFAVFMMTERDRFRHRVRAGAVADRQDHRLLRLARRRADADLPDAVHGRDGQVGAVPAAYLAAGRDGGPDPGLRADPCRDHGDRRRVHGGAAVAVVRTGAGRADGGRRWSAPPPRSSPPPSVSCRTTSSASSRIRPARSSATCSWRWGWGPIRSACTTCSPMPSSRRCCSWASGSVIHAMHHEQDIRNMGGLRKKIPLTYCADGDRHAGADRLPADRRLFLQGRHHRGGVFRQQIRSRSMPSPAPWSRRC